PELGGGKDTPCTHLDRNPPVGPETFGDKLRGQFGDEERATEERVPEIVIVRIQAEVGQKVVRVCLREIRAIQIQRLNMGKKRIDKE
ncbi:hypothetical protein FRC17_005708, partial [Serendipita sp. 399]